jgi:phenylacetate-CoA ligase
MRGLRSSIPEIDWPAIPSAEAGRLLGLVCQLEQTQWWPAEEIAALQRQQLARVLRHALETVPFYRKRLGAFPQGGTVNGLLEGWQDLPVLTRVQLQEAGDAVSSGSVPPAHGGVSPVQTSGSTGRPIRTHTTELNQLFWQALTVREHLWHRRDPLGKLVAIRPDRKAPATRAVTHASWGRPIAGLFRTGPSALLDSRADLEYQVRWLQEQQPTYLLTLPSNARALAETCLAERAALPSLRGVRTYGEALGPEVRAICREAWRVPVTDMYSAQEAGYIALQCPAHNHYHLQSEHLLVEVLDDAGRACAPGETGRVVLSTLHNFATPLIRYEIMDYVEVGQPCPCGRGLPVIRRILGRQRNLARTPDGRRYWPSFPAEVWMSIAPIRQIQLVQKSLRRIEIRYVMARALAAPEKEALARSLRGSLGHPYQLLFTRCDGPILRGRNGKYEDFVSELGD